MGFIRAVIKMFQNSIVVIYNCDYAKNYSVVHFRK